MIIKMEELTYDLKGRNNNSTEYYKEIEQFTEEVILKSEDFWRTINEEYMQYLEVNKLEKLRSKIEYLFEMMILALLWEIYSPYGSGYSKIGGNLVKKLYSIRKKSPLIKKYSDLLRGVISGATIVKKGNKPENMNIKNVEETIEWLNITGEYKEEIKRLEVFIEFLKMRENNKNVTFFKQCTEFGYWFVEKGYERLGKYTVNVDIFRQNNEKKYRFREDNIFVMRREAEYHLNMVGAALMNRAFKERFDKTQEKVLLIPKCMAVAGGELCKGRKNGFDIECVACSDGCNIRKCIELGEEKGFGVKIIPHSSDFTRWLERWKEQEQTGVVGVACILNLLTGGYEMKGLDIPAQCVLLDYCGCKSHWDKKGKATSLNKDKLLEVMGNK